MPTAAFAAAPDPPPATAVTARVAARPAPPILESVAARGGGAEHGPARQVGEPMVYGPPVDAPVVDGYRPPSSPYGAGNRGWEYDTAPGAVVRAAGAGAVTFAGPVGGSFAVTVRHPDGRRTSYSYLTSVTVRAGDLVTRGDPVGLAGDRFHFGVRLGDTYVDPATLYRALRGRPRLVPIR